MRVEVEDDLLVIVQQLPRERHGGSVPSPPWIPRRCWRGSTSSSAWPSPPRPSPSWCWRRPARARPGCSPGASPTGWPSGPPTPATSSPSPSPARPRASSTDRLGRLGLRGDATAGTFHAVAWGQLRARWADQGRTPPALLERKGRVLMDVAPRATGRDLRSVAGDLGTEIEWAKARMISPDGYAEAVAAAGRRSPLKAEQVAEALPRPTRPTSSGPAWSTSTTCWGCAPAPLEDDERFATAQRWRFRHLYVDELQDVNPLQFRLLEAWRGVGLRRHRGGRPAAGHLRVERRRRPLPAGDPRALAPGPGDRAGPQLPVHPADPRGGRLGAAGGQAARPGGAGHPG